VNISSSQINQDYEKTSKLKAYLLLKMVILTIGRGTISETQIIEDEDLGTINYFLETKSFPL
jgi:hypothetical protein